MFIFLTIVAMYIAGLRIVWDGRIPVSSTRVATGIPVKLLGLSLFVAAPLAYTTPVLLARLRIERYGIQLAEGAIDYLVPSVLLGTPALFALIAIVMSKPVGTTPPAT